jgi:hypothetical protein
MSTAGRERLREPRTKAGRALLEREAYNERSFPLITAEAIRTIEEEAAALAYDRPSGPVELDWHLRNLLRETDDPANWGVPEDYAAGWIAAIHAVQELAVRLTEAKPETPA